MVLAIAAIAARSVALAGFSLDSLIENSWFLAGFLLSPGTLRRATGNRVDVRQLKAPLLPLADQERYARAFRNMRSLESITGHLKDKAGALTSSLTAGLTSGDFRPGRERSPLEGTPSPAT